MTGSVLTGAVVFYVIPIFVARSQARGKNREWIGYALLGWFGVIILAFLPPLAPLDRQGVRTDYGECPYCREPVRLDAIVCPHCRRDVAPQQSS